MKKLTQIIAFFLITFANGVCFGQANSQSELTTRFNIKNRMTSVIKKSIKKESTEMHLALTSDWGTPIAGSFKNATSYGFRFNGNKVKVKVVFINNKEIFQKTVVGIPTIGFNSTF